MRLGDTNVKKSQLSTTTRKIVILLGIMVAFVIIMAFLKPKFLTPSNMLNILKDVSVTGVLAVGMTFVLITGGIDLSAGYNVTLGTVVIGLIFTLYGNPWLAIIGGIGITTIIGIINGLIITKMKIVPFIATLVTMSVAEGLIQYFGKGKSLKLNGPVFSFIGQSKILGVIPMPIVFMAIALVVGGVLLKKTRLGNYTYAIGCNEKHAKSAGINVHKCLIIIYAMEGVCAGIAALLLGSKVSLVTLNAGGSGTLMDTIAAVVLGGVSTAGGEGNMWGTVLGVIFMGFISNALTLLNVPAVAQDLFKGIVIICAIILNSVTSGLEKKKS